MNHARVVILILFAVTLAGAARPLSPQANESIFDEVRREHEWIEKHLHERPAAPPDAQPVKSLARAQAVTTAPQTVGVQHYRLQIRVNPDAPAAAGTVTIQAQTTAPTSAVILDAFKNMVIDAVRVDGVAHAFVHKNNRLTISFDDALPASRPLAIAVDYHVGLEFTNGQGEGMLVVKHGADNVTTMANLSEPYAAPSWWPCIDDVRDKATAEVEITAPPPYVGASNGVLVKTVTNPDQTTTYFWREDYPLTTYLLSVAVTNYAKFEDTYTALDGRTMPLVFYVYPEHLERAMQRFAVTRQAMQIFAPLFGEYPFINEKYGMAEFPWSGGMEHQTLTSLGSSIVGAPTAGAGSSSGQTVIAHELAHQWWGDLVTLRTWNDIWLNEGFATYAEVLFLERMTNIDAGSFMTASYDDGAVFGRLGGTVTAENLGDPFDDSGAVYRKGAWALHMLRHIMGDEKFFAALKDYRGRFAFANASTADFQQVCEEHYGDRLDWFFPQWIYAPGRPVYKVSAEISGADAAGNYTVTLVIKQKQTHDIPGRADGVYVMPLDVTIHYADGTSETRVVRNDKRKQSFSLVVPKRPLSAGLDEGQWVLKKVK
jgi:aminopeptidase N